MKTFALLAFLLISNLCFTQSQLGPDDPNFLIGDWLWYNSGCGASVNVPVSIKDNGVSDKPVFTFNTTAYSCSSSYYYYINNMYLPWSKNSSLNSLKAVSTSIPYNSITFALTSVNQTFLTFTAYNIANYYTLTIQLMRSPPSGVNTTACSFYLGSTPFNICALALTSGSPVFTATDPLDGKLSFSIAQNIPSNNGTNNTANNIIQATYDNVKGVSYLVANQTPTYSLLNANDPTQGLQIKFPTAQSSNRTFQLIVNLGCNSNIVSLNQTTFQVFLSANTSTEIVTIFAVGSSIYACPTTTYQSSGLTPGNDASNLMICGSVLSVSTRIFNLCPLNEAGLYNASDILQGRLSFSLSTYPQARCGQNHSSVWGVYIDETGTCYEAATKNPIFSLINQTNTAQGLQITYPLHYPQAQGDERSFRVVINLICSSADIDPTLISFTSDVYVNPRDNLETLTVSGRSIYGCPVSYQ